jgi:hypothetical protein
MQAIYAPGDIAAADMQIRAMKKEHASPSPRRRTSGNTRGVLPLYQRQHMPVNIAAELSDHAQISRQGTKRSAGVGVAAAPADAGCAAAAPAPREHSTIAWAR